MSEIWLIHEDSCEWKTSARLNANYGTFENCKGKGTHPSKENQPNFSFFAQEMVLTDSTTSKLQDMSMTWNKYSLNSLCPNIDTIGKKTFFVGFILILEKNRNIRLVEVI